MKFKYDGGIGISEKESRYLGDRILMADGSNVLTLDSEFKKFLLKCLEEGNDFEVIIKIKKED